MKTLLSAAMSGRSSDPYPLGAFRSAGLRPSSLSSRQSATESVECPKCRRRTIVSRSHNTFDCLNCNFHRELPPVTNRTLSRRSAAMPNSTHPSRAHLNGLFSADAHRLPVELDEDVTEPPDGQPWLFALIAVIFGILLL